MPKWSWIAIFLLTPFLAKADISPIFGRGDSKGTVLMLSMGAANPDAVAFFAALSQDPADEGGKWTKRFQFNDTEGVRSFTVVCAFSGLSKETGSCTLTFFPSKGVYISGRERTMRYDLKGEDAARLGALFRIQQDGLAFRSLDQRLVISAPAPMDGQPVSSLSIVYSER